MGTREGLRERSSLVIWNADVPEGWVSCAEEMRWAPGGHEEGRRRERNEGVVTLSAAYVDSIVASLVVVGEGCLGIGIVVVVVPELEPIEFNCQSRM
jgi:hypothetical protein